MEESSGIMTKEIPKEKRIERKRQKDKKRQIQEDKDRKLQTQLSHQLLRDS